MMLGTTKVLRIGTRGSSLALWQADFVQKLLQKHFPEIQTELRILKTRGDKILDAPLTRIGGKGVFTKELEDALFDHRIDIAVHSLKDVPTQLPPGLVLAAIPERTDAHDVFIAHPRKNIPHLDDLPFQATIATGSIRRKSQLLALRPDIRVVDIRGNLPTRLRKLDESHWDGLILARAGLLRLGLQDRITEVLSFQRFLPAVGQGAIAIECRADDIRTLDLLQPLHHEQTSCAVRAERALLHALGGGCQIPLGAFASFEGSLLHLEACMGTSDGSHLIRKSLNGNPLDAEELGVTLAQALLSAGGDTILRLLHSSPSQQFKEDDV